MKAQDMMINLVYVAVSLIVAYVIQAQLAADDLQAFFAGVIAVAFITLG